MRRGVDRVSSFAAFGLFLRPYTRAFIASRSRDRVKPLLKEIVPSTILCALMALQHYMQYVYPVVETMPVRPTQKEFWLAE